VCVCVCVCVCVRARAPVCMCLYVYYMLIHIILVVRSNCSCMYTHYAPTTSPNARMMFYWRFCLKTNSSLVPSRFSPILFLSQAFYSNPLFIYLFIYCYYTFFSCSPVVISLQSNIFALVLEKRCPFASDQMNRWEKPQRAEVGAHPHDSIRCMRAFVPAAKLPSGRNKLLKDSFWRKTMILTGKFHV
jgi:hypothetical protein